MKRLFTLLSILLITKIVAAQQWQGKVLDHTNQQALAYVNIGIVGKSIGTVSDEQGNFTLVFDSAQYAQDTLRFSIIGYSSRSFLVSEFLANRTTEISLHQKSTMMQELVISSTDDVVKTFGNAPKSKLVNVGFIYNNLGHEIGTRFPKPAAPLLLETVQLNFVKCEYEKIFLRLNIYKVSAANQEENLLKEAVYVSLTKEAVLRKPVVDVSDQAIIIDSDFIVSVEIVKDLGEKGLYFYASIGDTDFPAVFRATSQSKWAYATKKAKPVGISIEVSGR